MVHHDLHSEGFFTWLVGEDDHNSSLHVIQVDQVSVNTNSQLYVFKNFTSKVSFTWSEYLESDLLHKTPNLKS